MIRATRGHTVQQIKRSLCGARPCSSNYSAGGALLDTWPLAGTNTFFNVVDQGTVQVTERLGKFKSVEKAGWYLAVPVFDKISYIVDMREKAIMIDPLGAITKDNVSLAVGGNVFIQFTDAEKAAYGSFNPLYNVRQAAQAAMRAAIGQMELDKILHARAEINLTVKDALESAAEAWGIEILRYEITDITPDHEIQVAMDKQAVAERERREKVKNAEGMKEAAVLESEGIRQKLTNESEGALIRVQNEAKAERERLEQTAAGEAAAVVARANAEATAIEVIGNAIEKHGLVPAQLEVAREYVKMYGEMGKKSNTMLFMDKPGDVQGLLAQAAAVFHKSSAMAKGPKPEE